MPRPTRTAREATLLVSASNLKKTAVRVLNGQALVSPEIEYICRTLGTKATQTELDSMVLRVRSMPWANLMPAE